MTVATDDTYQEAKELEDRLFRQRQFIERQPGNSPVKSRFEATWRASYASLLRQQSLEQAYGTANWTAAKIRAVDGNKRAGQVFRDNVSAGIA